MKTLDPKRLRVVHLSLSSDDELRFERAQHKEKEDFEREVYGEFYDVPNRPAFLRPPGRPDLSYQDLARINADRREGENQFWKQIKKGPKSRVKMQSNAWALDLHESRSKMDPFASTLLKTYDFYLCRYVLQLVEADGETIALASIEITHPDALLVYRLWPSETHKQKGSIKVKVGIGAKVGITKSLDIVDVSTSASADIIWETSWKWAAAIVKAWGAASNAAGWELKRDSEAPFAGDRELYLMLQVPKGGDLTGATASVQASIKPDWLGLFVTYDSKSAGPVPINYHVGRKKS